VARREIPPEAKSFTPLTNYTVDPNAWEELADGSL